MQRKKQTVKLWIRLGDAGEYHDHDDLDGVADELRESGVHNPLIRHGYRIYANGFDDDYNYISAFWGTGVTEPTSVLTDTEMSMLDLLLT